MLAMLCFTFSSCGDDDDEKVGGNTNANTNSESADSDSNTNTKTGLSGYYANIDVFESYVLNDYFYSQEGSDYGYAFWFWSGTFAESAFYHFSDHNTVKAGRLRANKYPQSNAIASKDVAGTTLYFVVQSVDWVDNYTISDGAIYFSNREPGAIINGEVFIEGNKVQKL